MSSKRLSNDEMVGLILEYQSLDPEKDAARQRQITEKVIGSLENLIHRMVFRKLPNFLKDRKEDAFNEVCISIITGFMRCYDHKKAIEAGSSTANYAAQWIHQSIHRWITKQRSKVIHTPLEGTRKAVNKVINDEEMTDKERAYVPVVIYWDRNITHEDGGGNTPLMDLISFKEKTESVLPAAEEKIRQEQIKKHVNNLIRQLTCPKKRYIVRQRLRGKTLTEIGSKLGISKQATAQRYEKAMVVIKRNAKRKFRPEHLF